MRLKTSIFFFLFSFQIIYAEQLKIDNDVGIEEAILKKINIYRSKHGLSELKMDARILKEARNHSMEMAKHKIPFGHTYFHTRAQRLLGHIKNSSAVAENVAYNYKDAQDVVKNWLLSPGHKANIDGRYHLTGVGIARDSSNKLYFTQIFLR